MPRRGRSPGKVTGKSRRESLFAGARMRAPRHQRPQPLPAAARARRNRRPPRSEHVRERHQTARLPRGTCRNGLHGELPLRVAGARTRAWHATICFDDRWQGRRGARTWKRSLAISSCAARTACAAYPLAVVVDDAAPQASTIVRGSDLLDFTACARIHLQHLLGLPTPSYLHVPVVVNRRGREAEQAERRAGHRHSPRRWQRCAWPGAHLGIVNGETDVPAWLATATDQWEAMKR